MDTVYLTSSQIASDTRAILSDVNTARTLANIARRAARLFEVGYTVTETLSGLYVRCFQMISPESKRYSVKVSKTPATAGSFFGSRCSCPCFTDYNTCKHLQAVERMLAQEDAQVAEYEARMEQAECAETGCDPHAEF